MFFSKFDKIFLVAAFLIVFSIVMVAAVNVGESQPFHILQQIAVSESDKTSVDEDSDGVIDKAENVFCYEDYNSFENCLSANPVDSGVPSGAIIMWSGNPANIPNGWKLCDGSNGTPDLRGRFIVGYNPSDTSYDSIGDIGGAATVKLTTQQIPAHKHYVDLSTNSTGSHSHSYSRRAGSTTRTGSSNPQVSTTMTENRSTGSAGDHSHTVKGNTNNAGGGQAHENRPPYYTLAFIMKE